MEEFIVPLNLKSQRESRKMRQEDLAEALEITRVHVARLETGARGMSFILALKCAKLFGSLRVRLGEDVFEIAPVNGIDPKGRNDIPDDEELHDLNDVEHNLNVLNQAADVVQVMQRLTSSPLLLRSDSELSDALRIAKYKELFELDWALHGRIREGEQLHPHLVQEGLRRALAERPGAQGRESDEQVA